LEALTLDLVIPDFEPLVHVQLIYPKAHSVVTLGNTLPPSNVSSAPIVAIHPLRAGSFLGGGSKAISSNISFTLVLTDPDAPSREDPKWSQVCHWIATNITIGGSSTITASSELMSYLPPGPPEGTGKHRYTFLLFAPSEDGSGGGELTKPKGRKMGWGTGKIGYGVKQWAAKNDLVPVGGNFFYAEHED
jgi:phosphatidylethanolamine-binding protein